MSVDKNVAEFNVDAKGNLWDLETNGNLWELPGGVHDVAVRPDGRHLAT